MAGMSRMYHSPGGADFTSETSRGLKTEGADQLHQQMIDNNQNSTSCLLERFPSLLLQKTTVLLGSCHARDWR